MPTYDHRCQACGHEFETFQPITAAPVRKCPKCGKMKVKRLIGAGAGIIFKGSGFYQTDYRSESYRSAARSDKSSSTATAKSGDSAAASAPAAKAAKKS